MTVATPSTDDRVTEADLSAAAKNMRSSIRGVVPASVSFQGALQLTAAWLVTTRTDFHGMALGAAITGVTVALMIPTVVLFTKVFSKGPQLRLAQSFARERDMTADAHRREFETRLTNAMDMADTEPQVMSVAGRALRAAVADTRVEVLLADNSQAHLTSALPGASGSTGPGCTVESPAQCIAARRGQTQRFDDSDDLDACPHLQDRSMGRCSAVCVPVSIMGRTVGVVHWAEPRPAQLAAGAATQLEVVAKQLGARLGMLRVMSETELQASTDGLTGLPNRRSFENQLRALRQRGVPYTVVMADLDHFKKLNDTYGHECGDRALRTYAEVLRDELRPGDIACRHGGEEFAVALLDCTVDAAGAVCERLREALALTIHGGDLPKFTASYGLAPWRPDTTHEQQIRTADAALYRSKRAGRDRVTLAGDLEPAPSARDVG